MGAASPSKQISQKEWIERFLTKAIRCESKTSTHFNVLTQENHLNRMIEVEKAKKRTVNIALQKKRTRIKITKITKREM